MSQSPDSRQNEANRWFTVHVVAFLLLLMLALFRFAPPSPKGPDAAADVFSAGRVRDLLERIIRSGVPHPTGSLDHPRMRDVVIEEFRALGFEPEIQETFAPNGLGHAEQVQNIVVHMQGTEGDDAIALVTHYDSVPAGPGVADDGSGVGAILEIARLLAAGPAPRNDVIFLITDAEELGLYGAKAFADEHPLMNKIRAVLNWEARGTRGPSFMFQTGPNNLGLIRLMARHSRRSISTSLFPAIYELLPNDTDLTIFKRRGIAGMNFAFIGGLPHYHTPLDNMDNLDLGSVQHQGEHFLAMARALSEADLDDMPQADAVFFDVLGWYTLSWPEPWNLTFAIAVAVIAVFVLAMTLRKAKQRAGGIVLGLLAWPLALSIVALLGELACRLVVMCSGEPLPWWAWPQPICVMLWCLGIGIPAAGWQWIGRRVSGEVASAVMIVYWAAIGIVLAVYLPGGSYLFTVPAAVACGSRVVALTPGLRWEIANLAFLLAACAFWLPAARGVVDALGVTPSVCQTIPLALIGLVIAPTAGRNARVPRFLLLGLGLSLIAFGAAVLVPPYSEKWPQPVSIVCIENTDTGEASLRAHAERGHIPDRMRRFASSDSSQPDRMRLDVDPIGLAAPSLEVHSSQVVENGRCLKILLTPATNQHRVVLAMNPSVDSVTVNGKLIPSSLRTVAFNFSERREAELELVTPVQVELTVVGESHGLPATTRFLQDARPAWAVPFGNGDHTAVIRRIKF